MDDANPAVVSAPWLALYDAGVPAEAMPRHATVLHSFLSACERDPDKDFIHYCGIALLKILVLVFFFMPWLAIKLVLREEKG